MPVDHETCETLLQIRNAPLRQKLRRFNGGLFEDCEALPLNEDQLALLIEASKANWREVEGDKFVAA